MSPPHLGRCSLEENEHERGAVLFTQLSSVDDVSVTGSVACQVNKSSVTSDYPYRSWCPTHPPPIYLWLLHYVRHYWSQQWTNGDSIDFGALRRSEGRWGRCIITYQNASVHKLLFSLIYFNWPLENVAKYIYIYFCSVSKIGIDFAKLTGDMLIPPLGSRWLIASVSICMRTLCQIILQ